VEEVHRKNGEKERRAHIRFPVALEIRYSTSRPDAPVKMGKGQTIDLSSSGLRFSADRRLVVGQRITVYTDWPFSFGDVKLQHVISGVVIRTIGTEVAIQIRHYDMTIRRVRRQSR
jgi:hypothetical protein